MQYALLIYGDEIAAEKAPPAAKEAIMRDFAAFTASILTAGKYRGGEAFRPTATATTLRLNEGRVSIGDGAVRSTTGQLGGFYLVDARNLDEAMEIAARVPSVRFGGTVEIRPVLPRPAALNARPKARSSGPKSPRSRPRV
jgi:hypothetical protein